MAAPSTLKQLITLLRQLVLLHHRLHTYKRLRAPLQSSPNSCILPHRPPRARLDRRSRPARSWFSCFLKFCRLLFGSRIHEFADLNKGRFDHEVGPWKMAFFLMLRFLKKIIYKAFGPLTRCKLNVDQEE